jgi:3-oxoacyl-[acyl-carrier-protein] synthase I
MKLAMQGLKEPIDYINTHGTGTPVGDLAELKAIRQAFGNYLPTINSTKALTGHALGAAGVCEAIYTLLMMQHRFVAASANIDNLDPEADGMPIARTRIDDVDLTVAMSNSFGFGGTNASLVFRRLD